MANPWDSDPIVQPFDLKGALAQTDKALGLPEGFSAAQIKVESGFKPDAVSPSGALGLAQVMPATLQAVSKRLGRELDPMNPADAVDIHREVMRENLAKFGTPAKALMAYNGGWDPARWNNPETRAYVGKVSAAFKGEQSPLMEAAGRAVGAVLPSAQAADRNPWDKDPVVATSAAPAASAAGNPWDRDPIVQAKPPAQGAPDPTGSTVENLLAASGKAMKDAGRGLALRAGQVLSGAPASQPLLTGLNMLLEKFGYSPRATAEEAKTDIAESRRLDAPLMATKAGVAGNLATNALLLAPTAGANTPLAAGVVGGMVGATQPALTAREGAMNTLLGAAGGAGSQYIANKVPQVLQARVDRARAVQTANEPRFEAARAAAKEGYVIPPADLEPGVVSEAVSGLSGKIKTAQTASQRNQLVTDTLAKRALGLPEDQPITLDALAAIRNRAGTEGYAPVRNSGIVKADQQYQHDLDAIAQEFRGASKAFPGLADNGVPEMVAKLQQPLFDAGGAVDALKVLRAQADKAYSQGDKTLGKASRSAADAIEGMLERHLEAAGNPGALDAFREARQLIAKTYTVQKSLNNETGNVAAPVLARQLEKGKPLSDELLTIARTSSAFPRATQNLKEAPKQLSPLDFAVAAGGAAGGHITPALTMAARPLARNALLSGPVQARALQQAAPVPFTRAAQALLENKLLQLSLAPVGTAVSMNVGQ